MLLLSGNVEMNPGPSAKEQTNRMFKILELLPNIRKTHNVLLTKLEASEQEQTSVDEKITSVFTTLKSLKKYVTSLKSLKIKGQQIQIPSTALTE